MFRFSLKNLLSQKLRSLLCVIGISIAVIGVICIFAFSQGVKSTVHSAIDLVDGVVVMEKGTVDPVLSSIPIEVGEKIKKVDEVKNVIPWIWTPATTIEQISFSRRGFMRAEAIGGVDLKSLARTPRSHLYPKNLTEGRFLQPGDQQKTVISKLLAKRYNKSIGDTIFIRGIDFEIVGLYSVGNKLLDVAYIVPIEMARKMKSLARSNVSSLFVVPGEGFSKEDLIEPIEKALQVYTVQPANRSRAIRVRPNQKDTRSVSLRDAKRLRSIEDLEAVVPEYRIPSARMTSKTEGSSTGRNSISLLGISPKFLANQKTSALYLNKLSRGNLLSESRENEILISDSLSRTNNITPGSKLEINGQALTVSGIYTPSSNNTFHSAIVPPTTANSISNFAEGHASLLTAIPKSGISRDSMVSRMKNVLLNWDVRTKRDWETDFSDLMGQIDLLLMLISSLAIAVGTVGIINTMLMSVTERTSEFGILIASGWSKGDLLQLVLSESLILGVAGGIVGVVVGWGCVRIVNYTFELTINASTPPMLLVLSFLLSILVGIGGGLYPAYRTAKMDPIEAIRAVR